MNYNYILYTRTHNINKIECIYTYTRKNVKCVKSTFLIIDECNLCPCRIFLAFVVVIIVAIITMLSCCQKIYCIELLSNSFLILYKKSQFLSYGRQISILYIT